MSIDGQAEVQQLYGSLAARCSGRLTKRDLFHALESTGLEHSRDPRLSAFTDALAQLAPDESIDFPLFVEALLKGGLLVENALRGQLVIPDFPVFAETVRDIYQEAKSRTDGQVADYIPQLKSQNADAFGMALCSIDGQRLSLGEAREAFCVQSICKPINYCLALETRGADTVHRYVGREPSGRGFNELTLNKEHKPHNPMINSGAIMTCSLIGEGKDGADRFEEVMGMWQRLSAGARPGFNNSVYLSERKTADRNYALAYFMREKQAFPSSVDLVDVLEFYFQCCSIELSCESMSIVAATLANAGICPLSNERVISQAAAKNCLSLMSSCGLYDFSGEFAFSVGMPAKTGVSGGLFLVVPNVAGIALWAPPLDSLGNTVRGVDFCRRLGQTFNFHNFDSLGDLTRKIDPRSPTCEQQCSDVFLLCWSASRGDLQELQALVARGADVNQADYDGRTPLHLAASEGQTPAIRFLLRLGARPDATDRWGATPLEDAIREGHRDAIDLLETHGKARAAQT